MQSFVPATGEIFPVKSTDISADWISDVLTRCDVLDGQLISDVTVEEIKSGFGIMGHYARVHLLGDQLPTTAPRTLFAKYSTGHPTSLVLSKREVLFYTTIAPKAPLRLPLCYFAGVDASDTHVLILMEDVAEGIQGDSATGCSDNQAVKIVENLARLHARNWGFALDVNTRWLQRVDEDLAPWFESFLRSAWAPFIDAHDEFPIWAERIAELSRAKLPQLFRRLIEAPITVVHGDCQPSNLKFDVGDSEVLFLDWQLTMIARPSHDIVWYFTHGMPVEQRRRIQSQLIDTYFETLGPNLEREFTPEIMETDALFLLPIILLNSAVAADAAAGQRAAGDDTATTRTKPNEGLNRILTYIADLVPDRIISALNGL